MLAIAEATAKAVTQVAEAVRQPGGMEAVNLKVAERYVEAFGNVAKQGNTLILPANLADVGGMIASADHRQGHQDRLKTRPRALAR